MLNQFNLTEEQAKKFDNISLKNKSKIDKLLEEIFLNTNKNPKWILSPIFGRDYFQSDLLRDLNFLCLADYYIKKKKYKKIRVRNHILKKIIQQRYQNIQIISNFSLTNNFSNFFKLILSFFKISIYSILMIFCKEEGRIKNYKNKNIILIETFFSKNLYNKKYKDRYHKEIFLKLPDKIKKKSYFFPINLSIFYIRKYLKCIRNEKIKFIHPLDFLKLKDYIDSIFLLAKLGSIPKKKISFENFEVNRIIKYHIFFSNFNFSTFIAGLNYFFLKRLKEKDFNIEIILDWYENQIIDKGLCLGKNHFTPNSVLKGHMGYINDFKKIYYYTPTILEKKQKALPDEILLVSKGIYKKFYKKIKYLNFKLVPAIRNKMIFNLQKKEPQNLKTNVLIICSANTEENNFIFSLISEIYTKIDFQKFNIVIKLHPNTKINSKLKNKKKLIITNNKFYSLLSNSDIVISGGTTATIEAKILNKKIILIGNNNGITLNPLFEETNKLEVCYSANNLLNYLTKFSRKRDKTKINRKLQNFYFIKFSKKYFKNFYN